MCEKFRLSWTLFLNQYNWVALSPAISQSDCPHKAPIQLLNATTITLFTFYGRSLRLRVALNNNKKKNPCYKTVLWSCSIELFTSTHNCKRLSFFPFFLFSLPRIWWMVSDSPPVTLQAKRLTGADLTVCRSPSLRLLPHPWWLHTHTERGRMRLKKTTAALSYWNIAHTAERVSRCSCGDQTCSNVPGRVSIFRLLGSRYCKQ